MVAQCITDLAAIEDLRAALFADTMHCPVNNRTCKQVLVHRGPVRLWVAFTTSSGARVPALQGDTAYDFALDAIDTLAAVHFHLVLAVYQALFDSLRASNHGHIPLLGAKGIFQHMAAGQDELADRQLTLATVFCAQLAAGMAAWAMNTSAWSLAQDISMVRIVHMTQSWTGMAARQRA